MLWGVQKYFWRWGMRWFQYSLITLLIINVNSEERNSFINTIPLRRIPVNMFNARWTVGYVSAGLHNGINVPDCMKHSLIWQVVSRVFYTIKQKRFCMFVCTCMWIILLWLCNIIFNPTSLVWSILAPVILICNEHIFKTCIYL